MRLKIFVLLSVVLVMALGMGCGGGGSSSGGSSGGSSTGGGSSTPSVAGTWNLVSSGRFPSQIVFNTDFRKRRIL